MAILTSSSSQPVTTPEHKPQPQRRDLFKPVRYWLDQTQITNRRTAHLICRIVPSHCPFERDISLFGTTVHIPALCRINPVYDEIVSLRVRALNYLAETCGEDVTSYVR